MIFVIISSVLLFNFSKKELLPQEDRGVYLVIGFTDEGGSFEYTKNRAPAEQIFLEDQRISSTSNGTSHMLVVTNKLRSYVINAFQLLMQMVP